MSSLQKVYIFLTVLFFFIMIFDRLRIKNMNMKYDMESKSHINWAKNSIGYKFGTKDPRKIFAEKCRITRLVVLLLRNLFYFFLFRFKIIFDWLFRLIYVWFTFISQFLYIFSLSASHFMFGRVVTIANDPKWLASNHFRIWRDFFAISFRFDEWKN